jgi:mevalonate kinase
MQTMDLPAETRFVVACSTRRMGFDQVASELKQRIAQRDPQLQHYLQECAGLASETRRRAGEARLARSWLGATMDAAHMLIRSAKGVCKDEVDAWGDTARKAGAYGAESSAARSEGGCAVALADTGTAPHVARALAAGRAVVFTDQIGPAA